uniref:Uncharacterized protein n=1 Tax=Avena sativa TaxID=4498 RepID=A0ACD5U8M8_AVESA
MHSVQGCRLTLADTSAKWLNTTSTAWISFGKQTNISCNATQGTSAVASTEKVDFLKLQNGSDIRGVAIAGVEGELVNITEPVTEAIAAAFASWLLNKKKADGLRRLRISVGHDSQISAHKLQTLAPRPPRRPNPRRHRGNRAAGYCPSPTFLLPSPPPGVMAGQSPCL